MVEVLADVEDFEADEVLEVFGEGADAVEASVEDSEGGHVGGGVGEGGELVGVYGEFLEVEELEAHCVREFCELVEVCV